MRLDCFGENGGQFYALSLDRNEFNLLFHLLTRGSSMLVEDGDDAYLYHVGRCRSALEMASVSRDGSVAAITMDIDMVQALFHFLFDMSLLRMMKDEKIVDVFVELVKAREADGVSAFHRTVEEGIEELMRESESDDGTTGKEDLFAGLDDAVVLNLSGLESGKLGPDDLRHILDCFRKMNPEGK